jgi:hypothetical protein
LRALRALSALYEGLGRRRQLVLPLRYHDELLGHGFSRVQERWQGPPLVRGLQGLSMRKLRMLMPLRFSVYVMVQRVYRY